MSNAKAAKELTAVNQTVCENMIDDFSSAVNDNNVREICKIMYLVEELGAMGRPKLQSMVQGDEHYAMQLTKARKQRDAWKKTIKAGDTIDVYSEVEFKWFESKVLSIDHASEVCRVHYNGWPVKYDADLVISEKQFCPAHTFTNEKRKGRATPAATAAAAAEPSELTTSLATATTTESIDVKTEVVVPVEDTDTQGRASRRRSRAGDAAPQAASNAPAGEDAGPAQEEPTVKKPKVEKDINDWICGICGLLEAQDRSELVMCEAACLRSFHRGCMATAQMQGPLNDVDAWYCPDCRLGAHRCFLCDQYGADYKEVHKCNIAACGKFYHEACLKNGGTRFLPVTIAVSKKDVMRVILNPDGPKSAAAEEPKEEEVEGEARSTRGVKQDYKALNGGAGSPAGKSGSSSSSSSSGDISADGLLGEKDSAVLERLPNMRALLTMCQSTKSQRAPKELDSSSLLPSHHYLNRKVCTEGVRNFKCPLHSCFNCFEFYGAKDAADLVKCIYCPRALHVNCMIPGSRFNSKCVVCPLHPEKHLPSTEITRKEVNNEFSLFWEQLAIPDAIPDVNNLSHNHFRLQRHIKESYNEQPLTFKMISSNDYEFMTANNRTAPPGFIPEVACECKEVCGEHCLNRVLRIECCDTKRRGSSETSACSICPVGSGCTNRVIQQRKYAKTEAFREFQMGWGLRAKEAIGDGALVMEYVGEVIDFAEVHRRMASQRQLTPNDRDFYIMELDNGLFVDGKFKGSNSRFINHSCDPNCELQRWVVKGKPRIGIFALRDIAPGEALSYDYQFDTKESETFKCYCGTAKCRGTMAPDKKKKIQFDAQGRPQSREERQKLIALGKQRAQAENDIGTRIAGEWSRSYTGKYVPGDRINEMRHGPVKASLRVAKEYGLFLVRNVRKSANFLLRKQLLIKKASKRLNGKKRVPSARSSSKRSTKPFSSPAQRRQSRATSGTAAAKRKVSVKVEAEVSAQEGGEPPRKRGRPPRSTAGVNRHYDQDIDTSA